MQRGVFTEEELASSSFCTLSYFGPLLVWMMVLHMIRATLPLWLILFGNILVFLNPGAGFTNLLRIAKQIDN